MLTKYLDKVPGKAVLYCLIAFVILVASLLKKDVGFSIFENRTMEYFHGPRIETVLSGEWFETFERYNLDQVIGRESLVESNSRALALMGKKGINGMTVYDDGTLVEAAYDLYRHGAVL